MHLKRELWPQDADDDDGCKKSVLCISSWTWKLSVKRYRCIPRTNRRDDSNRDRRCCLESVKFFISSRQRLLWRICFIADCNTLPFGTSSLFRAGCSCINYLLKAKDGLSLAWHGLFIWTIVILTCYCARWNLSDFVVFDVHRWFGPHFGETFLYIS
jgi:hypothetical protein